jgi:hypothetical protein
VQDSRELPRLYGPGQATAKALLNFCTVLVLIPKDKAASPKRIQGKKLLQEDHGVQLTALLQGWNASMRQLLVLLPSDGAQDIAEYAVMVAVILLIVLGTVRLIGSNSKYRLFASGQRNWIRRQPT